MKAYLLYKDKSIKEFKKLINTGGGVFDKYRMMAVAFIRYARSGLDENLARYGESIDLSSIQLEKVFPANYKWFVKNMKLVELRKYIKEVNSRADEFQGKEDNLKVMVGVHFLRFVLLTKLVESYLSVAASMASAGMDVSTFTLQKAGIGKAVLKYLNDFEDYDSKTIDDWKNASIDSGTAKYFYSSMKRIMTILTKSDTLG